MLEDIHRCEECGGNLYRVNLNGQFSNNVVDLYKCVCCGRMVVI